MHTDSKMSELPLIGVAPHEIDVDSVMESLYGGSDQETLPDIYQGQRNKSNKTTKKKSKIQKSQQSQFSRQVFIRCISSYCLIWHVSLVRPFYINMYNKDSIYVFRNYIYIISELYLLYILWRSLVTLPSSEPGRTKTSTWLNDPSEYSPKMGWVSANISKGLKVENIDVLRDGYNAARTRFEELSQSQDNLVLPLKIHGNAACKVYSVLSTLLYSSMCVAKADEFEKVKILE